MKIDFRMFVGWEFLFLIFLYIGGEEEAYGSNSIPLI